MRYLICGLAVVMLSFQPAWAKKDDYVMINGKRMPVSTYMERMLEGGPVLDKDDLAAAIANADTFPLGSKENPVRAESPVGQRAYLARLKCQDNSSPAFMRAGNLGPGVYGSIIDDYVVTCAAAGSQPVHVVMDMYFKGYVEARPVPGFTIDGGH